MELRLCDLCGTQLEISGLTRIFGTDAVRDLKGVSFSIPVRIQVEGSEGEKRSAWKMAPSDLCLKCLGTFVDWWEGMKAVDAKRKRG